MIRLTVLSLSLLVCLTTAAPFDQTTEVPASTVSSGPTTTREPFIKLSCKGHDPNGFFVDENNPHKFHECVNGEHVADFWCAGALIFDEHLQQCILPGPPVTTTGPGPDLVCPESVGIFPYPGDKHKFIECNDRHPYVMNCPGNLVFDPVSKTCVYDNPDITDPPTRPPVTTAAPTNPPQTTSPPQTTAPTKTPEGSTTSHPVFTSAATTSAPVTTAAPTTSSPVVIDCSKDGYFADPTNKHQYIICSKGHKTIMTCPPGMEFDPNMEMCK